MGPKSPDFRELIQVGEILFHLGRWNAQSSTQKGTCDGQRLAPGGDDGGGWVEQMKCLFSLKDSFKIYNDYYYIQVTCTTV